MKRGISDFASFIPPAHLSISQFGEGLTVVDYCAMGSSGDIGSSNKTLDDYGPSMREMSQPFVRASFNAAGEEVRKKTHSKSTTNEKQKKDVDDGLDVVLEEQETEIKALEEEMAALKTELLEEKIKYYGGYNTSCNQNENCNNYGCEGDDCSNETVMKYYMRRKWFKSVICKTPYTGYSPKL
ncbi:hypothetical protein V8G54_011788 [Vigna mungo]|uniref:Uncharacterized protein n=1 Tax=Vigna mungo TaxID=3915 RepID=A0AAQ3S1K3_VIGMU